LTSKHPLEEIIHPRSIAVVGASNNGRGQGFITPLQKLGFKGEIYPVNPKYSEILGMKAYPTIKDIPGPVDYVISSIPAAHVLKMVKDSVEKGVKGIHLFTARFSETGRKDAAELEQKILREAQKGGVRIIGPNCMGLYYPSEGISFSDALPKRSGSVGLASQSGGIVHELVELATLQGVYFSKAISYGNALDFNEADYLEYFSQDPDTELVLMYIEGVRDGKRFFDVLRKTTVKKPVIILKGGRGKSGTRATASHTASLAGSMEVWNAAVTQAGAVIAEDLEELVDIAAAFNFLPPILGRSIGVAGGSGGGSVMAADLCEEAGLDVIPLPDSIREDLKSKGSPIWDWIGNPADFSIAMENFDTGAVMQMMAMHPDFNLLAVYMHPPLKGPWNRGRPVPTIEQHIDRYKLREMNGKPVMIVMGDRGRISRGDSAENMKIFDDTKEALNNIGKPVYTNIKSAARAAAKMVEYYERRGK